MANSEPDGVKISSFDYSQDIDYSDSVTGLKGNNNSNFTFALVLSWIRSSLLNIFLPRTMKGAASGIAELDANGKVPAGQLPTIQASADHVSYENTSSGLDSTNVQYAIDEILSLIPTSAADVGLGNVANERQYSANNPPPYPVTSVNGETGAVVLDYPAIYRDTTAAWNAQITLVAEAGSIYVYTDYASATVDGQTVPVPGIKIGDGTSYLIDMAFAAQDIAQALAAHAADTTIHVTAAEKQAWNNKVSVSVDGEDLAFSTTQ